MSPEIKLASIKLKTQDNYTKQLLTNIKMQVSRKLSMIIVRGAPVTEESRKKMPPVLLSSITNAY